MQKYLNARKRPLGILRAFGLSCFWELIQITGNANHHYLFFKKFHFLRYFKYFIFLLFLLTISEILDYKLTTFETIKIKIAYKICRERNKVKNGAYIVLLKLFHILHLIDLLSNRVLSLLDLDEIIKLSLAEDGAWLQVPPKLLFSK